ncbi:MAG: endonuclease/exonuclease/phosphatase family protein [Actinomycetota bacterium]
MKPRAMARIGASLSAALIAGLLGLAPATASPNGLVVSEFRFRGPSGGNDEFVELLNTSGVDVDISGYKFIGCSATGPTGTRATVPAGVTLEPGEHYLFTNTAASGYSGTVPGDTNYTTGVSDTGGAQLVTPADALIDAWGSTSTVADCREGAGLTLPTTNGDNAFQRKTAETQDTDDNAADFVGPQTADPDNWGEDPEDPPGTITKIHDVQGSGATTPANGQTVAIEGIVVGHDDEDGFNFERNFPEDRGVFVQEETSDQDADPATSEGIFVGFVDNVLDYPLGSVVKVEGQAKEKFGLTMIAETFGQEPTRVGTSTVPLPEPVTIDATEAQSQPEAGKPYYETLEAMRVRLAEGTANSGGTTKFDELFLTPGTERNRVFRTESEPALLATDADAGAGDPQDPFEDPDGSSTVVNGNLFDTVQNVVGPFAFSFNHFKIMVQADVVPTVVDGPTVYPFDGVDEAGARDLRVASFNVENFFPEGGFLDRSLVTLEGYEAKRDRIVDAIDRLLKRPDVLAMQEVDNLEILQEVANLLGGYTAYLEEGNDNRGIDVGFLIADHVQVDGVRQVGKEAPGSCSDVAGRLFDRPPLIADVTVQNLSFSIFSNHFSSKSAPDSCREAQAEFVAEQVNAIEAGGGNAMVAGDLNAFETEGALSILQARTSLDNLWDRTPNQERYSFAFDGKLQTLDHILITDGLEDTFGEFQYAHFDNDYSERDTEGDGHKVSDHDPPLATFVTDACPDGDDRTTVFVREVNSGVTNYDTGDGCTINDLIVEEDHPKKRDLRRHVDEVTASLEADGIITEAERDAIREAAQKAK